ncbi:GNAT family N-acetyltransferase [Limisphaera sp. 4302-co]|uniref:GNAT family N-acetyltransferase n=1 Tax=Limisphaera sp. 4302-co TaxID=3400417 RepID=UPI003C28CA2D
MMGCSDRDEQKVVTLRRKEEFDRVAEAWRSLEVHPNSSLDHYLFVCDRRAEVISPLALGFQQGGEWTAFCAGRLEDIRHVPRLGYARLVPVKARVWTVVYGGLLGAWDGAKAEKVIACFSRLLDDGICDFIRLHGISRTQVALWDAFGRWPSGSLGALEPRWSKHYAMTIEHTPGFLLRRLRSKHRSWLKGRQRRLEDECKGQVQWVWYDSQINVDQLCEELEAVARTTYQRRLGAGFIDGPFTRERFRLLESRGTLRVALLKIRGEARAFWQGTVWRDTYYSGSTGYTPDMRSYEAGTLLFLWLTDRLAEEGVNRLDFGLGQADYKERFATESWEEADVVLFGKRARSRLLAAYLRTVDALNRAGRALLADSHWVRVIKRQWRDRLIRRGG